MRGPFDRGWRRCICVASGPSLQYGHQKETIRAAACAGWRVFVTNSTWADFPDADVLFGADLKFWDRHAAEVRAAFRGECWTGHPEAAKAHGLRFVEMRREVDAATGLIGGLARDGTSIRHCGNSGAHQLALAYLFGMEVGILSGYDFQHTGGTVNADGILVGGPIHHHGPHPAGLSNPQPSALAGWAQRMAVTARDLAAAGCVVVNASAETALDCFPRADLCETLANYSSSIHEAA